MEAALTLLSDRPRWIADALCLLLAWDSSIEAAAWFLRDDDRKILLGSEAVDARNRERGEAMWLRVRTWADALYESGRPPEAHEVRHDTGLPVFEDALSRTAHRLKFSVEDSALALIACMNDAPGEDWAGSSGLEEPAEIERAFGVGAWTYLPVYGAVPAGAPNQGARGVLALRTPQAGSGEQHARWRRWASLLGRLDERATALRAVRAWERERQQLDEASGDLNAVSNVQDLLQQAARSAARLVGARWSLLWMHDPASDALVLKARSGSAPAEEEDLDHIESQAREVFDARRLRILAGPGEEGEVIHVPLMAFDRVLGVVAVGVPSPAPLSDSQQERALMILARQTAVSARNAELSASVRKSRERIRDLETRLLQNERLATLGEMAAKLAQELRAPLHAVEGFARRIERALPDGDASGKYAALIAKEVRRLEHLLEEQLEFVRLSEPRLQNVSMLEVVKEAVQSRVGEFRQREVHLIEDYEPGLPTLLLDVAKVRHALDNVFAQVNGELQAGTTLRVACRRVSGSMEIEVSHDGEGVDNDVLEKLFVPFATRTAGGGLGLALAKQIVDDHGGELLVRSGETWSVSFLFRLPIRTNQDRRKSQRDRRLGRDRRRAA